MDDVSNGWKVYFVLDRKSPEPGMFRYTLALVPRDTATIIHQLNAEIDRVQRTEDKPRLQNLLQQHEEWLKGLKAIGTFDSREFLKFDTTLHTDKISITPLRKKSKS